ncbi:hypothetical protein, partial [Dyella sp.]|uniref:hypothetical protein n=1 Tax=Dyella sp. TaxID=1869338 RepID=UPI002ED1F7EC
WLAGRLGCAPFGSRLLLDAVSLVIRVSGEARATRRTSHISCEKSLGRVGKKHPEFQGVFLYGGVFKKVMMVAMAHLVGTNSNR